MKKTILSISILLSITAGAQTTYLQKKDNIFHMPDEWLLSTGRPWHFNYIPSNKGRLLIQKSPTPSEKSIISKIEEKFNEMESKVILLGNGNNIVFYKYKSPANENSLYLSASIDKTVTAISAGVALCDGKITFDTKLKDVLPEFKNKFIGNSTLRQNLMMASGTTTAFDDSESISKSEHQDVFIDGTKSVSDLLMDRLGNQEGFNAPGKVFDYKSQDPFVVGMMISAAYGLSGKNFRKWQSKYFFNKIPIQDRLIQGQDKFGYAQSSGNTRLTLKDWARFADFVQATRKKNTCLGNYIKDATSTQILNSKRFASRYSGYGYFTWTENMDIPDSYSALGYGGQAIIWSKKNSKYMVIFSNTAKLKDIHYMAKLWLESK